jgi:hypothetical protein
VLQPDHESGRVGAVVESIHEKEQAEGLTKGVLEESFLDTRNTGLSGTVIQPSDGNAPNHFQTGCFLGGTRYDPRGMGSTPQLTAVVMVGLEGVEPPT